MAPPVARRHLPSSPFNAQREAVAPADRFQVGDRVAHDRHGLGRVIGVEPDIAVDIDFGSLARRIATPSAKLHKL